MAQAQAKTFTFAPAQTDDKPLKIGEVARRTGIGIETLRFYERSGLLGRPARTEGGYRLYSADELLRLEFIKRAQTLGFTLEEIKQIMAESHAGQRPCDEVREIVRARLAELDERLKQMRRYRNALAHTLQQWDDKKHADGHFCGLIEATELDSTKPVARRPERRKK
ncbi:MAG TPA: heavy metal-responsive transcriptional regulator [Blastocatellia bacterium]|nr:heavy metal-responsive transcriptional regulator [Blastocatellia bacterium]